MADANFKKMSSVLPLQKEHKRRVQTGNKNGHIFLKYSPLKVGPVNLFYEA